MPAKAMDAAPAASKQPGSKKFELPALDFKFASLTEGTDIPAPLPSPVQEEPAETKAPSADGNKHSNKTVNIPGEGDVAANGSAEGQEQKMNGTVAAAGTKRPADDTPLSPALSSRQGSIRKLFSRTFLNNSYEEGEAQANGSAVANGGRPPSRSNTSILDEKKAKRSSGWFRRLRPGSASDGTSKRSSAIYQEAPKQQPTKPAGPPPPMIPEFGTLSPKLDFGNEGSLGGDELFKDIK